MKSSFWEGKSAIITGGSAGLGLELARALADQNVAKLMLVARNAERLQNCSTSMAADHSQCKIFSVAADTSCAAGAEKISASLAESSFGPVDLLINAVGLSDRGTVRQLTADRLRELIDINVVSTLRVSQQIYSDLRKPGAVIVNVGSLASLFAPRYLGGYAVAKHALAALTQQMRLELSTDGIHVMLACPGPIRRVDSGERYRNLPGAEQLPAGALKSGGGAKIKGLDACNLAQDILSAAAAHKHVLVRPRKARLLQILLALSPTLGEFLLRKMSACESSASRAPAAVVPMALSRLAHQDCAPAIG